MIRKRTITKWLLLLGGLYATGLGLWQLGAGAVFVHEALTLPGVVVDVRERPFQDYWEALSHGNLPWEGSVAHQPHVRYEFAGLPRVDDSLPDLDNADYDRGQAVEIILHPRNPHERHLNKAKFIWGRPLVQLGMGLIMLLLWRLLRPRRRASVVKQAARRVRDKAVNTAAEAVIEHALPASPQKTSQKKSKPKVIDDLRLTSDSEPPHGSSPSGRPAGVQSPSEPSGALTIENIARFARSFSEFGAKPNFVLVNSR